MKFLTLEQALKVMRCPTWTGTPLFAKEGELEVLFYKGIDMQTLTPTNQLFVDAVTYGAREFENTKSALRRVGFVVQNASVIFGSDGEVNFYNINACLP